MNSDPDHSIRRRPMQPVRYLLPQLSSRQPLAAKIELDHGPGGKFPEGPLLDSPSRPMGKYGQGEVSLRFAPLREGGPLRGSGVEDRSSEGSSAKIMGQNLVAVNMAGEDRREAVRNIAAPNHLRTAPEGVVLGTYGGPFHGLVDAENPDLALGFPPTRRLHVFPKGVSDVPSYTGESRQRHREVLRFQVMGAGAVEEVKVGIPGKGVMGDGRPFVVSRNEIYGHASPGHFFERFKHPIHQGGGYPASKEKVPPVNDGIDLSTEGRFQRPLEAVEEIGPPPSSLDPWTCGEVEAQMRVGEEEDFYHGQQFPITMVQYHTGNEGHFCRRQAECPRPGSRRWIMAVALYFVGVGWNTDMAEAHDLTFCVGEDVESILMDVRNRLDDSGRKGFHFDGAIRLDVVDGYFVKLKKNGISSPEHLFLVHIGFYIPGEISEQHRFLFLVDLHAESAKRRAKAMLKKQGERIISPHVDSVSEYSEVDGWHLTFLPTKKSATDNPRYFYDDLKAYGKKR